MNFGYLAPSFVPDETVSFARIWQQLQDDASLLKHLRGLTRHHGAKARHESVAAYLHYLHRETGLNAAEARQLLALPPRGLTFQYPLLGDPAFTARPRLLPESELEQLGTIIDTWPPPEPLPAPPPLQSSAAAATGYDILSQASALLGRLSPTKTDDSPQAQRDMFASDEIGAIKWLLECGKLPFFDLADALHADPRSLAAALEAQGVDPNVMPWPDDWAAHDKEREIEAYLSNGYLHKTSPPVVLAAMDLWNREPPLAPADIADALSRRFNKYWAGQPISVGTVYLLRRQFDDRTIHTHNGEEHRIEMPPRRREWQRPTDHTSPDSVLAKSAPEVLMHLEQLWAQQPKLTLDVIAARLTEKFGRHWRTPISPVTVSSYARDFDGETLIVGGQPHRLSMPSRFTHRKPKRVRVRTVVKTNPHLLLAIEELWRQDPPLTAASIAAAVNQKFSAGSGHVAINNISVLRYAERYHGQELMIDGQPHIFNMPKRSATRQPTSKAPARRRDVIDLSAPAQVAQSWGSVLLDLANQGLTPTDLVAELERQGFTDIPADQLSRAIGAFYKPPSPDTAVHVQAYQGKRSKKRGRRVKAAPGSVEELRELRARRPVPPTLAESRPGPPRDEMAWLAGQLLANPKDRASGATAPFDWDRLDRVFTPYVVGGDPALATRFKAVITDCLLPPPGTTRLYGHPHDSARLAAGAAVPNHLADSLAERRQWLQHRKDKVAPNQTNEANAGRLTRTRTPLATLGPGDSLSDLKTLAPTAMSLRDWHTLFPNRILAEAEITSDNVLGKGEHNAKLGGPHIVAGHLTGLRLMTVTLAERNTCPIGCDQGDICYGNGMQYGNRFPSGKTFTDMQRMAVEQIVDAGGRVVLRKHALGDYDSLDYVEADEQLLTANPGALDYWIITRQLPSWHPMAYLNFNKRMTVKDFEASTAIGDRLFEMQLRWQHNVQLWFSSQLPLPGNVVTLYENPFDILTPEQQAPLFMDYQGLGKICPAEITDPAKAARIAEIHARQRAANPDIVTATLQGATGRKETCADCTYCLSPMPGRRDALVVVAHGGGSDGGHGRLAGQLRQLRKLHA